MIIPNIFLIIVACIVPFIVVAACFFFLVYFSSPDDKNQAWLPKIVVIASLALVCISLLMLPFDVLNVTQNGHLDTFVEVAWQIVYMAIALFVIAIIPFAIFYYEAQDPSKSFTKSIQSQIKWGCCSMIVVIFVSAVIIGGTYWPLGKADIPYKAFSSNMLLTKPTLGSPLDVPSSYTEWDSSITMRITPVIYIIAALSFVGWIFFIFLGGCGLTALPMELLIAFKNRPKRMKLQQYSEYKVKFKERSEQLLTIGRELDERIKSGKGGRKTRKLYNIFKQAVYSLEDDYKKVETAYKDGGGSPFKHAAKLIAGIICLIVSFLWIVHIILYLCFPWPIIEFLSFVFQELETLRVGGINILSPLAILLYSLFTFHMVYAVVAGAVKISEKFTFFAIHPLKVGDTLMNSFLFNVALILLCSMAITQFSAYAFSGYAVGTAVDSMFRTYIRHLVFMRYFWIFYPHAFVLFAILAFFLCIIFRKKPKRDLQLSNEMKEFEKAKAKEERRQFNELKKKAKKSKSNKI